jgi:hypothetical protein
VEIKWHHYRVSPFLHRRLVQEVNFKYVGVGGW